MRPPRPPPRGRGFGERRRSVSRILSVPPDGGRGSHFSGPWIAPRLKRPTRECIPLARDAKRAASPPLFGLAPGGVCRAPRITAGAVSSYLAFSPLPFDTRAAQRRGRSGRYVFCDTVRPRPLARTGPPLFTGHPALRSSDFPHPASHAGCGCPTCAVVVLVNYQLCGPGAGTGTSESIPWFASRSASLFCSRGICRTSTSQGRDEMSRLTSSWCFFSPGSLTRYWPLT